MIRNSNLILFNEDCGNEEESRVHFFTIIFARINESILYYIIINQLLLLVINERCAV